MQTIPAMPSAVRAATIATKTICLGHPDNKIEYGFSKSKTSKGYDVWIEHCGQQIEILWTPHQYQSQALFSWLTTQLDVFFINCVGGEQTSLRRLALAKRFVSCDLSYKDRSKAIALIDAYIKRYSED